MLSLIIREELKQVVHIVVRHCFYKNVYILTEKSMQRLIANISQIQSVVNI